MAFPIESGQAYGQFPSDDSAFNLCKQMVQKIHKMILHKNNLSNGFFTPQSAIEKIANRIFPRILSLEDSTRKMQKNLIKASCEHWNQENKRTSPILDTILTLDILLLKDMEQDKESLHRESPELLAPRMEQMASHVLNEVFSEAKESPIPNIRKRWTPESLHKEWLHGEQLLNNSYINPEVLTPSENNVDRKIEPLEFTKTEYSSIGMGRAAMEDAHFYISTEKGTLLGIFDGHGGSAVANYASYKFQEQFFTILDELKGNVHQTFEFLFDKTEKEIVQNHHWMYQGCTALVSFIDNTNNIFTATLGDSEANVYRTIENRLLSIPLSVLRDWSSPEESKRAATALGIPSIEHEWSSAIQPKTLRFHGINISRTLGDFGIKLSSVGGPGVIHKPKITMTHLEHNDLLVLACDGLKDYAEEKEILRTLTSQAAYNPAEALGALALSAMTPDIGDNITIIALSALNQNSL